MNNEFLTAEQAAKRAGVSRPTVSRALKFGDLPGNRDNLGRWSILPADVDAWAEKTRTRSGFRNEHRTQRIT